VLADHGHLEGDQAGDAVDRARVSARDLPAADRLGRLLHDVAARAPQIDPDSVYRSPEARLPVAKAPPP